MKCFILFTSLRDANYASSSGNLVKKNFILYEFYSCLKNGSIERYVIDCVVTIFFGK